MIRPPLIPLCTTVLLVSTGSAAWAQASPYTFGVTQAFSHESNVFNVGSGASGDTLSSTTLRAAVDQPFGRQRFNGSVSATANKYRSNEQLDNTGYALRLGLDWATIERLSGNLSIAGSQSLAQYNSGLTPTITSRNVQRNEEFDARVRYGMATRLGLEATAGLRQVSFSAPEYAAQEYRQNSASLGVTYEFSGLLSSSAGLSLQRSRYPNFADVLGAVVGDRSSRRDVFVTANWTPTGASSLNARINVGRTDYDRADQRDFSGITGNLAWNWQPTAKLQVRTQLTRDSGQETGFLVAQPGRPASATDFSRLSNTLGVNVAYAATAKISAIVGATTSHRTLADNLGSTDSDTTTTLSIGANWQPTRTLGLGCNLSRTSRSGGGALAAPYDANSVSCFGSFTLN